MTAEQMQDALARRAPRPAGTLPSGVLRGISTDSRDLGEAEVFCALVGERYDAHAFCLDAAAAGARLLLVNGDRLPDLTARGAIAGAFLGVDDTLCAYGDLAHSWRAGFNLPLIAVTGSNGKTTVKEMLAAIARAHVDGAVLATQGNLNNLIGVPRTLLDLDADHRAAIIEMGMNHSGEIARLAEIAAPTVGVITNIGPAHLEGLGSLQRIAEAKSELFDYLSAAKRPLAVNLDTADGVLRDWWDRERAIGFSEDSQSEAEVRLIEDRLVDGRLEVDLVYGREERMVRTALPARFHTMNVLAAAAAAYAADWPGDALERGLNGFAGAAMRFERQTPGSWQVINDAYNANPASMLAGLSAMAELPHAGRRVALLGDMAELGETADELHRQTGRQAAGFGIDAFWLTGTYAEDFAAGLREGETKAEIRIVDEADWAAHLAANLRESDLLYLKASRSARLERVIGILATLTRTGEDHD